MEGRREVGKDGGKDHHKRGRDGVSMARFDYEIGKRGKDRCKMEQR